MKKLYDSYHGFIQIFSKSIRRIILTKDNTANSKTKLLKLKIESEQARSVTKSQLPWNCWRTTATSSTSKLLVCQSSGHVKMPKKRPTSAFEYSGPQQPRKFLLCILTQNTVSRQGKLQISQMAQCASSHVEFGMPSQFL